MNRYIQSVIKLLTCLQTTLLAVIRIRDAAACGTQHSGSRLAGAHRSTKGGSL